MGENTYTGKWIWNKKAEDKNAYVNFKTDFTVSDIFVSAQMMICADTEYALWINGKFVCCGQYRDYPDHLRYDKVPVSDYLKKGENSLFLTVYYQGEESMQYSRGDAGVWFMLTNGKQKVVSNKDVFTSIACEYKQGEIFKTTVQLGYGFIYNAKNKKYEWENASETGCKTFYQRPVKKLVLSKKENVKITAQGPLIRIAEEKNPAITMQHDYLSYCDFDVLFKGKPTFPGQIEKKADGDFFFLIDFKEERCGYLYFDIETNENACIDISYGQTLDDLRVRSYVEERSFANRYTACGGRQKFAYFFKRISGRYMEVHVTGCTEFKAYDFGIIRADYPLKRSGSFYCPDSLHNKIHDICVETLVCCIHEHYEDTPWREQALYTSDSRNQMLFCYYAFSEFEMAKSSLMLLARGIRKDAHLSICAPTDIDLCIPSFSFIWFLEMKEYMCYSGDTSLAVKLWKQIEYMLETYTKHMKDGIFRRPRGKCYWHYYEWSEGNYFAPPFAPPETEAFESAYMDALYNAFLALALKSALYMAKKLEYNEFYAKYSGILKRLIDGINKHFWNEEKKLYCSAKEAGVKKNYGELMQSIAILAGIAKGEKADILRKTLARENNGLVKITLAYTIYKYEALLKENAEYISYVMEDIKRQWGKMAFSNAVTVWELDKEAEDFGRVGSFCHGWSAVPIYIYYRYILGITPKFMRGETNKTQPYKYFSEYCGSVRAKYGQKMINPQ